MGREVGLVKFGTQTLPNVDAWSITYSRNVVENPIPGRSVAYRSDVGATGAEILVSGIIYPKNYSVLNAIKALADGTVRTLNFELDGFQTYQCIMLDPEYTPQPTGSPLAISYELRFVEVSNP
ncbi:hypothetical protein KEJ39_03920 [Candidatus Bathyarchaeota archaeon]|nr:hypothetical protein [Candidatus Bathyarchaeota archaeon]